MNDDLQPQEQVDASQNGGSQAATEAPSALEQELEALRRQAAEYLEGWRRAQADMANQRRRHEKEKTDLEGLANARLVTRLLPILDDLDRAVQTVPAELQGNQWVSGIELIARKLRQIFEADGVRAIPVKPGEDFDPNLHEAILHEETEGFESGQVVAELQKGYTLGERVLRPAVVKVAK